MSFNAPIRRFQPAEGQQKKALPGSHHSPATSSGGRRRYGLRQAFCSVFSPLKLSGVARKLSLAAGKNSAPRARRPQPRCNVDQAAKQKRHGHPLAPARSGCGQRALSASNSSPASKLNPLATPAESFNLLKGNRREHCQAAASPPPPLPGGAGRDCPPARNCPRRLAPVGPDSTLPAPKR